MELPYGDLNVDKKIRSCKSFGGPVKLGFSICLPVLRSGKSFSDVCDNFGGGPGTFCWYFFNFMFRFAIQDMRTSNIFDSFKHCTPYLALPGKLLSVVKIWDKIDDVILITAPHCTQIKFSIAQLWKGLFGIFCKLKCFSYACHCHITIISMG